MTPDWSGKPAAVPYANYGDPQSLNLYEYVGNNPNTGIDMDGHITVISPDNPGGLGVQSEDFSIDEAGSPGSGTNADGTPSTKTKGSGATPPPPKPAGDNKNNPQQKGQSLWSHLSSLILHHSWNYVKATVTDNETYTIAGVAGQLPPMADGPATAAKAATQTLKPTPNPIPLEPVGIPGQSVPPEQTMEPGDIPEIEPGALMAQKWGVTILNIVKGIGQNVKVMPMLCFTCNMNQGPLQQAMFGTSPED
jgi:hypothetical protein